MTSSNCFDLQQLDQFERGSLDDDSRSSVELHLRGCSPCRQLLDELRANRHFLSEIGGDLKTMGPLPDVKLPDHIGDYRIIRRIGRGGMGVVYEAEQQNPKRPVALKLIRLEKLEDPYHVGLFQREAQALARLSHPGIAAIHEAGRSDDGQHFLVMELVRGVSLSEHVRAGTPSLRERLALFGKVCDAVNYAHQRGVLHRDLKPSNVLIDDRGEPKILDFGLARLAESDSTVTTVATEAGKIQGTLPYMSPEQVRGKPGEIDIRSDVYSLGVILYELLTGRRPYELEEVPLPEVARIICEHAPAPPSTIERSMRGDMDTIVMKAIEKDLQRRYQSAAALADDIERFRSRQPIAARPPSPFYYLRKLVCRNPLSSSLGAVLLVLIVGSVGLMTHQYRQAKRLTIKADNERNSVVLENSFLNKMMSTAGAETGRDVTIRESLEWASSNIDKELGEDPKARTRVHLIVGRVYYARRELTKAETHLSAALELSNHPISDEDHIEVAEIKMYLGRTLRGQSRFDEASEMFNQALNARREFLGNDHRLVADTLDALALVRKLEGNLDEAERLLRRALLIHPNYGVRQTNLARVLIQKGQWAEGARLLDAAESAVLREGGDGHLAFFLSGKAKLSERRGDTASTESYLIEAVNLVRNRRGSDHPIVAVYLTELGDFLRRQGRFDRAERALLEGLSIRRARFGDRHRTVAESLSSLGRLSSARGDWEAARSQHEEALRIRIDVFPEGHPSIMSSFYELGVALCRLERFAEAEPELRHAVGVFTTDPGVTITESDTDRWLGVCLLGQERFEEAESLLLAAYDRSHGDKTESARAQATIERLIKLYQAWKKDAEAAEWSTRLSIARAEGSNALHRD